ARPIHGRAAGLEPEADVLRPDLGWDEAARGETVGDGPRVGRHGLAEATLLEGLAQAEEPAPGLADVLPAMLVELRHGIERAAEAVEQVVELGHAVTHAGEYAHASARPQQAAGTGQHLVPAASGQREAQRHPVEPLCRLA